MTIDPELWKPAQVPRLKAIDAECPPSFVAPTEAHALRVEAERPPVHPDFNWLNFRKPDQKPKYSTPIDAQSHLLQPTQSRIQWHLDDGEAEALRYSALARAWGKQWGLRPPEPLHSQNYLCAPTVPDEYLELNSTLLRATVSSGLKTTSRSDTWGVDTPREPRTFRFNDTATSLSKSYASRGMLVFDDIDCDATLADLPTEYRTALRRKLSAHSRAPASQASNSRPPNN